ncbi:MAG: DUF4954 family protein [Phycisphaerae bacterium]|nr:DUF4954 family protein [Phycisphaerae bacterium]
MNQNTGRRLLTQQEIDSLVQNGCTAADWKQIQVTEPFYSGRIIKTHFSGKISLGLLSGVVRRTPGVEIPCGIYHASLHNCRVGFNTLIRNVSDIIANMDIEDHVVINDVRSITTHGTTTFGSGTGVAVVNENGGRAFPIYEGLSAQVAYLLSMYRHQPRLLNKLQEMIFEHVRRSQSDCGFIGTGANIQHCGVLKNVKIGPAAILEGVSRLENGTVVSCPEDPTRVGVNVIAKDFIFAEGSDISDAGMLTRCFAGQGVRLGKGFSAVDSVFFANSHFEQGEACSVFAGPFTVSHHKSTLLIAGLYSFYNAGSGTNQSNHMYKLGPVYQGIFERGCKTGSESYLLWPARIGAFTTVIGKHSKKMDLSDLPFSCLVQRHEKSQIFPGLNLTNIGLVRNEKKWLARDVRKAPDILDFVNPAILTPYTAQKMVAGIKLLSELMQKHPGSDSVLYSGIHIPAPGWAVELYQLALDKFYGQVLACRIQALFDSKQQHFATETPTDRFSSLKQYLRRKVDLGLSRWVDVAGLLTPADALSLLLEDIQASRLDSLDEIQTRFEALHTNYAEYEWAWVLNQLEAIQGKSLLEWSKADFKTILEKGARADEKLTVLVIEDAAKEFVFGSQIGYGIDGPAEAAADDFEKVCGTLQNNPTVKMLTESLEAKKAQLAEIVEKFFA